MRGYPRAQWDSHPLVLFATSNCGGSQSHLITFSAIANTIAIATQLCYLSDKFIVLTLYL